VTNIPKKPDSIVPRSVRNMFENTRGVPMWVFYLLLAMMLLFYFWRRDKRRKIRDSPSGIPLLSDSSVSWGRGGLFGVIVLC